MRYILHAVGYFVGQEALELWVQSCGRLPASCALLRKYETTTYHSSVEATMYQRACLEAQAQNYNKEPSIVRSFSGSCEACERTPVGYCSASYQASFTTATALEILEAVVF